MKATTLEEMRLRAYREGLGIRNDRELREMETQHRERLSAMVENQNKQVDTLKEAYNVQISREAERMAEKLDEVRYENERALAAEKALGDEEVRKARERTQAKIEQIQKNQEAEVERMEQALKEKSDLINKQGMTEERRAAARESVKLRTQA